MKRWMSAKGYRAGIASLLALGMIVIGGGASAAPDATATIAYQPMTDGGLTAGLPFEAWLVFGDANPAVPGYALPAGASIRITFPPAFIPEPGAMQGVVLLYGWPQNAIDVPFSFAKDPADPRTMVITLKGPIAIHGTDKPGLKSIHLRTDERNPAAGDYPIKIELVDAGPSSGTLEAVAHISPERVPNIAQYNQLHSGRNEDWQHVQPGQTAPLPVDLLVTRNAAPRATLTLARSSDGILNVVADGKPIGTIESRGVPLTLVPQPFGPGFARLGIVRFEIRAGSTAGMAEIEAKLDGGTTATLHVIVEH